ncbi:MAG: hypothetical protein ABIR47_10815 [Candidatus Kapaibacterium sp.]
MSINILDSLATMLNRRDEIPNRNIQADCIRTKLIEKSKQMESRS